MRRVFPRPLQILSCVGLLAAAGCASPSFEEVVPAVAQSRGPVLQCVPYARLHSAVKLQGDAWLWWDRADGRYEKGARPHAGAVMVLTGYAGPQRGHLAVVRSVVSPRVIHIDHANWFNDGAIYVANPVADVSSANDWSVVRVWNMRTGAWGGRAYPVQGFIGPGGHGEAMAAWLH